MTTGARASFTMERASTTEAPVSLTTPERAAVTQVEQRGKEDQFNGGGKQFEVILEGEEKDDDLGWQEKVIVRDKAKQLVFGQGSGEYQLLFYIERYDSLCCNIKVRDIKRTLATIHDTHGHYSTGIAGRASGRHYWTTRRHEKDLSPAVIDINTSFYGLTPDEILQGYNSLSTHLKPHITRDWLASATSTEVLEYVTDKLSQPQDTQVLKHEPTWEGWKTVTSMSRSKNRGTHSAKRQHCTYLRITPRSGQYEKVPFRQPQGLCPTSLQRPSPRCVIRAKHNGVTFHLRELDLAAGLPPHHELNKPSGRGLEIEGVVVRCRWKW